DELRVVGLFVAGDDGEGRCPGNDVIVRKNVAARVEDEPGADTRRDDVRAEGGAGADLLAISDLNNGGTYLRVDCRGREGGRDGGSPGRECGTRNARCNGDACCRGGGRAGGGARGCPVSDAARGQAERCGDQENGGAMSNG